MQARTILPPALNFSPRILLRDSTCSPTLYFTQPSRKAKWTNSSRNPSTAPKLPRTAPIGDFRLLRRLSLQREGYGRPTGGDEVSLTKIKRDSIVKFYDTYYTPGNTILAVAGDFNAADVKKKIEDTFGTWPAKPDPRVKWDPVAPAKGKRLLLVNKSDATQTFFVFGNIGTTATDPDRVAIRVVNTVFGSRFTSMLNEALRVESGLSYGAGSFFRPLKCPGRLPFTALPATKPPKKLWISLSRR